MTPVYVLLVTYFLHGGLTLSTAITAHSDLDCKAAAPLVVQMETDKKHLVIAGHSYKIDLVDAQCVIVPTQTSA